MSDLTELDKLEKYLKDHEIQYERIDTNDRYKEGTIDLDLSKHQICVPCENEERRQWDAICQWGSYGYEEGLLEIYGSLVTEKDGDSVVGYLTAYDVIRRIEKEKNNNDKE